MKVMKFGGTSVGSVNSILNVKKIVEAEKEPVKGFVLVWMINENELKKVVK